MKFRENKWRCNGHGRCKGHAPILICLDIRQSEFVRLGDVRGRGGPQKL